MIDMKDILRIASLAAVLAAGSCAAPINDGTGLSQDGAANHPIAVEPTYQSLKLPFAAPAAGLMPDDAARFAAFVNAFLSTGNGAISIAAPAGPDATQAIAYFGERLAQLGVPRTRILVGTRSDAGSDSRVELGYIGYAAHTDACGDWSKSLGDTSDNGTPPNFGCAVQHNIAAMVADPRDLVALRGSDAADATRRTGVVDAYEKGKSTPAEKTQDQSGTVSDVNKQ
jgi:pilus assembly protein CpaD